MSKPLIDSVDFRYENTLRIDFNLTIPVGLGSSFEDIEDIDDECKEDYGLKDYTDEQIIMFIQLTEQVNGIIYKWLGSDIEIDWRGNNEVEVHNVIQDINIQGLTDEINKLG